MRLPLRIVTLGGLASLLAAFVFAADTPLSEKELKKALRQADKAYESGRHGEALPLYEDILASTQPGDARRASALWGVSVQELGFSEPRWEQLRAWLEELSGYRLHDLEADAMLTLLDKADKAHRDSSRLTEQIKTVKTQERRQQTGLENDVGKLREELEQTRQELADAKQALAAAKDELAKKDEAIQKLRDTLIKSGG